MTAFDQADVLRRPFVARHLDSGDQGDRHVRAQPEAEIVAVRGGRRIEQMAASGPECHVHLGDGRRQALAGCGSRTARLSSAGVDASRAAT